MLLAIDPGRTTGTAQRLEDGAIRTGYTTDVETVLYLLTAKKWDAVVIEDFTAQIISSDGIWTVRLVGVVEGVCWDKDIPLFIQRNVERKSQIDNAKNMLGYPNRKTLIHEVDALAHLLRFEYNTTHNLPHRKRDWHE